MAKTERRSGTTRRLRVSVQCTADWPERPRSSLVREWLRAALGKRAGKRGQVTVRFVDREEGRRLNRDYRSRDYPTNVLSFAYQRKPVLSADLVVCFPVATDEAAELGVPPEAHCAHLIVHGALHLLGYDHEAGEKEAARMEKLEVEILARLGYPDPYAER
ncbi:rRNA maturation RNase YbeY [Accumulibacter sp.]|uniref:rRNA maturation RNase YbeY n=1 Tax=Accumulibacter sp. TaxID=2053492 RepID=UPI0025EBA3D5|nr:rRNA maturation RNase YbeY [Accumulibacter sp.]MCM8595913.1 rRNA maturation RNase YbeY [Accumulibacter sp.]MCM8624516.1 rRNA maturation RNase YbeY [Accumulibacter sp.]MDS4050062.1 rRNA maturation RNase YbeY [Accumulibacter sp.]